MICKGKFALMATLAVALLSSSVATAKAAIQQDSELSQKHRATANCPSKIALDLLVGKASIALEQGQYSAAIDALEPVKVLDCDTRVSLLIAAAYEENRNLPQAVQILKHAHSVWPADTSIATSLAREYLTTGDQANAVKALDQFHASASTPWQEIQLSVVVFLAAHHLSQAEGLAQLGYHSYPSIDSLLLLANTLQLEGRYKDVIALMEKERASYATSAKFLVTLAESEYDANIFDLAQRDVEQAISLDKTLYQAYYLLGNVQMKQGDAEPAKASYELALQLAPEQPRTYYHLALALRSLHDEAGEESVLSKAIAIDDQYGLAHCELGRIYLNQNRVTDAIAQLEMAIRDNSSSEEAYSLLARAYERAGYKDKAEEAAKLLAAVRKANHQAQPTHGESPEKVGNEATP